VSWRWALLGRSGCFSDFGRCEIGRVMDRDALQEVCAGFYFMGGGGLW
jgi:hypothetical protein